MSYHIPYHRVIAALSSGAAHTKACCITTRGYPGESCNIRKKGSCLTLITTQRRSFQVCLGLISVGVKTLTQLLSFDAAAAKNGRKQKIMTHDSSQVLLIKSQSFMVHQSVMESLWMICQRQKNNNKVIFILNTEWFVYCSNKESTGVFLCVLSVANKSVE